MICDKKQNKSKSLKNKLIMHLFYDLTDEDEERLLVDWFTLIHEKHLLVRREAELVYTYVCRLQPEADHSVTVPINHNS